MADATQFRLDTWYAPKCVLLRHPTDQCLHVAWNLRPPGLPSDKPMIEALREIVLHDLNDRVRNILLVLSEVQEELNKLKNAGVIPQATWDRLAAHKIEMPRLTITQGRQILEARLESFLQPFEGIPEVNKRFKQDGLFPLGTAWFGTRFEKIADLRPRHLIVIARERWQELQKSLAAADDGREWFAGWPHLKHVELSARSVDELIDEQVEKAITERVDRHLADPKALPPNADSLCGFAKSLLEAGGVGLAVARPKRGSPYDLLIRSPQPAGGEITTGLVFITTGSAMSVTSTLGKLTGDAKPPDRVLLVTDHRQPLAFSKAAKAQGRNYYNTLKSSAKFKHLELSFSEYAMLEALDTIARQASDLEIDPPGGSPRSLKQDEVFASYRRTERLKKHPLFVGFFSTSPTVGTC